MLSVIARLGSHTVMSAWRTVEVAEQRRPRLPGRLLAGESHDGLAHHGVGLALVVPSVLHPESCLSVPRGHPGAVNPRHAPGVDAHAAPQRLVGADEQARLGLRASCGKDHDQRHGRDDEVVLLFHSSVC